MLEGTIWGGFSNVREWMPATVEELRSPKGRHLFAWWSRVAQGSVPPRSRFDIVEHAPIVRNVFLIEVDPNGNFHTRIVGGEAAWWVEEDRERKLIRPDDPIGNNRLLHRYYSYIVAQRAPLAMTGSVRFIHTHRKDGVFEGVDCPLADETGRISTILGVLDLVGPDEAPVRR